MKITVKEITIVKPAEKTPRRSVWMSDLDLLYSEWHTAIVYFYRPNRASNFFDLSVLKKALSKVLVPFYPVAGRFSHDQDGRLQIDCNEEGVPFIEADSDFVVDDFGDFLPSPDLRKLIPTVDYSAGISSYPFLLAQVTYFQCGGASLGIAMDHRAMDGFSNTHFINAWSEIARGLDLITIQPFLDRTLLHPRNPPQLKFNHVEYQVTHSMKASKSITKSQNDERFKNLFVLKINREQLNILKRKVKEEGSTTINYSTYEILAGHIWRCACLAGALPNDQQTKLYFPVNGRSKLEPPLPLGYFGNVIFSAVSVAKAGDLKSKPLWYAANCIHETLVRQDNDYLRSAIDYLKLHPGTNRYGPLDHRSPNFAITSWINMPLHDADFGWGKPFYMGPGGLIYEGRAMIIPNAAKDGSFSVLVALPPQQIKAFEKLFFGYDERKQVRANL